MLSNLSDLLFSRVDPDPVQTAVSQTAMVGMSPQALAQAQQPLTVVPAEAKYLQAGKPVKQFNATTANMTADNPEGAPQTNKYAAALKGDYTALGAGKGAKSSDEAYTNESPEMKFKRFLLDHKVTGEELDKRLWEKEQSEMKKAELQAKGLPQKQVEKQVNEFLKNLTLD